MKNILIDWKNRLKKGHMSSVICVLLIIVAILGVILYQKQKEYRQASENSYNMTFFELVDYVQNVENYLAKSLISSTPEHGAETLTHLWRESNLAQSYLSRLPIESQELSNTEKFLNQVSDYSYSLSRKNIYNEKLTDDDFDNLKELHTYSVELENTLNQLSEDLNSGRFSWGELTEKGTVAFAQQVDNISKESFSNLEENFHEYSGLIYDGAYSEHLTSNEPKALTGDDVDENKAKAEYDQEIAKLSENIKIANEWASKEKQNTETLENELKIAEEMKGHFNEYDRMVDRQTKVENLRQTSEALTNKIELARTLPGSILKEVNIPVKNLTVEDGIPLVNGLTISNLSEGEKLMLCVDVTLSNPNTLKLILIDGVEKLSETNRNELYKICKEKGLQIIATRTTDNDELNIIEL